MRSVIFGTLLALTVTAATAAEDIESANRMLPGCKGFVANTITSRNDALMMGLCLGTVGAIAFMAQNSDVAISALSGEGQAMLLKGSRRCADIPSGVTNGQMVRVVVRYIEARSNRIHEPFHSLALEALLDAWPCRK
jgi:Rap1a immunity proteins